VELAQLLKRSNPLIDGEPEILAEQGTVDVSLIRCDNRIRGGPRNYPDLELALGGPGQTLQGCQAGARSA
jgi:hypothetical protein